MVNTVKPLPELQDLERVVDGERIRQIFGISVWKSGIAVTFWTVEISVSYSEGMDTVPAETVKTWKHLRISVPLVADRTFNRNTGDLHFRSLTWATPLLYECTVGARSP